MLQASETALLLEVNRLAGSKIQTALHECCCMNVQMATVFGFWCTVRYVAAKMVEQVGMWTSNSSVSSFDMCQNMYALLSMLLTAGCCKLLQL